MRKLIFGVIIVVALIIVFMRGDSFFELIETMKQGSLVPLVIAIASQLCKYFAQSVAFSNSFKTVGERISPKNTINLVFGMFFMNTVAPSVGASGIVLVVDDARKRGISTGRATSAAVLMQISIDTGFLIIMVIGFIVLGCTGNFNPWWLLFALLDAVLVGIMTLLLVLGGKKPDTLMHMLEAVERLVNKILLKFKRAPKLWADDLVESFSEASRDIAHSPAKAVKVFAFSVVASACELTCFILCGISFGVDVLPALIGGYIVATLFAMVSITPQGVGFVEVAIVAMMSAYGVNMAASTAIGIVYRGLVFWMPFIIGAILINRTKTFEHKPRASQEAEPVEVKASACDTNGEDRSDACGTQSDE